jgi:hypothetical protein
MKHLVLLLAAALAGPVLGVARAAEAALPPAAARPVDFVRDVKPLLEASCIKCHAHGQKKSDYAIDSRETFLAGGKSGPAAVPGRSADSLVVQLVAGQDPDRVMPAKGPRWTPEQVGLLRAWIDQGAPWPEGVALGRGARAPLAPRQVQLPPPRRGLTHPVDRLLEPYFARHGFKPPKPVADRVFARRVYLDVIGLLPTPAELAAFEKDRRPDKRARLVRQLLADSARYAEHWLTFWNDCLRNDYRGTGYIDGGRKQITPWLYAALATNMPFDSFVARLVNPDEHSEGFARGIVWRGAINASQTPQMQAAQNISQVFLGLNLKCASCHDSYISDWKLTDAYGLASVYADEPLELVKCDTPTGQIAQRKFLFPELGQLQDSTNRAERLASLARLVTHPQNGRLTRTVVNRLWAKFMGRGLVEPVDEMDNPPWHADLLDWLAWDFAQHGYDLKHTMEVILTSRAYSLPAVGGEELVSDRFVFRGPLVKRLTAEQYLDGLSQLTGLWRDLPDTTEIDFTTARPDLLGERPRVRWIWSGPDAARGVSPGTLWLRKTFTLAEVPDLAFLAVAADNRFRLFVNGREAGSGDDWNKPRLLNIRDKLTAGDNLLAVEVTNDETKKDDPSPNPAGFLLEAWMRAGGRTLPGFGSDASWRYATNKVEGWEKPQFAAADWLPAVELGPPDLEPWRLQTRLTAAVSAAARHGTVRASLVAADPLSTALGRPNREQVNTTRPTAATTLQALELTNGETLTRLLTRGAERLLQSARDLSPRALAGRLVLQAFGRPATRAELEVAEEMLGRPPAPEGVADFLWALTLQPEFQLIY